ncbi:MAG: TolC family protein [Pontiellaceae bacterium]|nr:TolC family protein [Pontiellaceae bacterium]MBN2785655.1 TolC family protein [Pontiellaceae bacterium]
MKTGHAPLWIAPALLLGGCTLFSPPDRSELKTDLPAAFSQAGEGIVSNDVWWTDFGSPELNALIEEVLTESPSIQQAWARLQQAEAMARQVGAARLPTVGYFADAKVTKAKIPSPLADIQSTLEDYTESSLPFNQDTLEQIRSSWENITGTTLPSSQALPENIYSTWESYDIGLSAGYEVDLWGRVRSQTEAATLDRAASQQDLDAVAMTLTAQVAELWAGIISQRNQTELIRQQLESNKKRLELIELHFRQSTAGALDVLQQRQVVEADRSRIPLYAVSETLRENQLAVLLGRTTANAPEIRQSNLPVPEPLPATGIPADLLANRPDVQSAWLRLLAADLRVSSAKADRLPAIRLTATASYGNSPVEFSDILDNWAANLAAGLTGPLFDGGRRKSEVRRARAVADERIAAYRNTVLNAIREVEDALAKEAAQREYMEALERRLETARASYNEAVNRYLNGALDYTAALFQLNTLQGVERETAEARYTLFIYRIALYRALGGHPIHHAVSAKPETDS